ncbi:hypothetical protein IAD21_04699 [Abditibacteriota bacterium]|nr:hypothetical protein IAD21_04699 [Abditibacteriota bacterium]
MVKMLLVFYFVHDALAHDASVQDAFLHYASHQSQQMNATIGNRYTLHTMTRLMTPF